MFDEIYLKQATIEELKFGVKVIIRLVCSKYDSCCYSVSITSGSGDKTYSIIGAHDYELALESYHETIKRYV